MVSSFLASSASYLSSFCGLSKPIAEWVYNDDDKVRSRKLVNAAVANALRNINIFIPRDLTDIIVEYLAILPGFSDIEWTTLCGRVALPPPLPSNFYEIWNGPCPFDLCKKVRDTHMIIYLPSTVDDQPLTLKSLREIARRNFPQPTFCGPSGGYQPGRFGYHYIDERFLKEYGDIPIGKPGWVLMKKDIEGEYCSDYESQKKLISFKSTQARVSYEVPSSLEAATCMITYFLSSRKYLFSDRTFAKTQDNFEGYQVTVGGFGPDGLNFCSQEWYDNLKRMGIAPLRRL